MSTKSIEYNQLYLSEMMAATDETVLGRLRNLWWQHYLESIKVNGLDMAIDTLDLCMDKGREEFIAKSVTYATSKGHQENTASHIQAINQFLKSNTGKMFERFSGLALAHALLVANSDYCIVPFRAEMIALCHGLTIKDFAVEVELGKIKLPTIIDADLFAFNPSNPTTDLYFISVKSTLKDRFHNVPFWNLLRRAALSNDFSNVVALNPDILNRVKYIAICSDLAKEQPDFAAEKGARNMLNIDAALLDGAFVTASKAKGLGSDLAKIGYSRTFAFYPLSSLVKILT